ncbi:S41 family peptidase [Paenibacillus thailandensis]|uniref:S41 family peptidase n=1 Tax=Paenibacillus thailandensis TaxID=393250 RepID=A0ABW5QWM0_9BACL
MYDMKDGKENKRGWKTVAGAIVCAAVGFLLCWGWMLYRYPMLKEPAFHNFAASYQTIMDKYLEGADAKKLIDGASEGMVASLGDPYSSYMAGELGEAYKDSYEGEFYGIGAEVRQEDGQFVINALTKDAPAERSGLLPGDRITAVDGNSVEGLTLQDLVGKLRGDKGTKVKVTVERPGEQEAIDFELTREAIPVETVSYRMLEDGIGLVTISRFAEKTAEEFDAAIAALKKEGEMKGLLLDLRSNPGGLLEPTLEIADMLVPKDKTVVQVAYKDEKPVITYKSRQKEAWNIPIAVLVNGQSASASEVLTAALKESAGAVVIGEKTFGKGIVQAFSQFKDGSVLSLTQAQWKSPNGEWIHKQGIKPDIEIKLPDYAYLKAISSSSKLKLGSYGDDVKTLQTMLKTLGYGPVGDIGYFGEQTASALRAFQQAEGLEATGEYDGKTAYRMIELLSAKLEQEDTQLQRGIEELKK